MPTVCASTLSDVVPVGTSSDLFAWAGIRLNRLDPPSPSNDEEGGWRDVPGTNLKIWARPKSVILSYREREPIQLVLAFPNADAERLISPRYSVFMSATLRGVLRANPRQISAATYLMRQDILYVGDIAKMSAFELAARLGPYLGAYEEIRSALVEVGLCNGGLALWWRRPNDYYAQAL